MTASDYTFRVTLIDEITNITSDISVSVDISTHAEYRKCSRSKGIPYARRLVERFLSDPYFIASLSDIIESKVSEKGFRRCEEFTFAKKPVFVQDSFCSVLFGGNLTSYWENKKTQKIQGNLQMVTFLGPDEVNDGPRYHPEQKGLVYFGNDLVPVIQEEGRLHELA